MATIINTMKKRIVNSKSRKKDGLIVKSFLMGAMGYFVFLFTLATTYWFTSKLFRFGLTKIDINDLMISTIGFFILFLSYLVAGTKQNNFHNK